MTTPSIACIGVIGKNNNPLHVTIFPSYNPLPQDGITFLAPLRTPLQYSLLLSSCLDIFEARHSSSKNSDGSSKGASISNVNLSGDLGLLMAVDERISAYGYETNTGVKFVCVVDQQGRKIDDGEENAAPTLGRVNSGGKKRTSGAAAGAGVRDADVKIVFKAMQNAYVRLLQNPFYDPDEHSPVTGRGGKKIDSKRFANEMRKIGEGWALGVLNL